MTPFEKERLSYAPKQPSLLNKLMDVGFEVFEAIEQKNIAITSMFSFSCKLQPLKFLCKSTKTTATYSKLRVAVVFSGGQAPGGHNVIAGAYDALKALNPNSELIGFLNGPQGLLTGNYIHISEEKLSKYRNQGGFDFIGSGRTKIETKEQFQAAANVASSLKLDGIIVIGGDDSNTNAAFLAEFFLANGIATKVIGVPKTIDGDLKNEFIDISFGFDTASKVYANLIGNIQRDALSAKKYTHFIKLMGRSASHLALECALKARPNYTLLGEEIESCEKTLLDVVKEIADVIAERSSKGKEYGVILIPEGLLEFCADCKALIKHLNELLSKEFVFQNEEEKRAKVLHELKEASKECFLMLPRETQKQLLLERDPHGNVNVSKIETEKLLIEMVQVELNKRKEKGFFAGKFNPQPHFYGYEGRACAPSNFDADYCYSLGKMAALLVNANLTGYIACIKNMHKDPENWEIFAIPLVRLLNFEKRGGKEKAVIKKSLVDLTGSAFKEFEKNRNSWSIEDAYAFPECVQYFGPNEIVNEITETLRLEGQKKNWLDSC